LFYSAAAEQLIAREDRCEVCGGLLQRADIRTLRIEFVGVAAALSPASRN
jgi:hypothetical protein